MAYATSSRRQAGRRPATPARKPGTWKLAYADFLTALMAFFLLMWLVSGVSTEDRAVIAAEFSHKPRPAASAADPAPAPEAERLAALLHLSETLKRAGDSLQLTALPDGLRLELVDTAGRPLFETGSGALNAEGRTLLAEVSALIAALPNEVSIEGHTDAFTLSGAEFTNWDLASARANEARRLLTASGLPAGRIRAVTGYADTRPLAPGQPHLAANRRISLELHTAP
ncbi:OmpA family protein [Hyphomonas sp.]|uniref:OmpA family protein n=1 Tax=Hyphomonas sp. TaxID=87 RepID=UPI00391D3A1F